MELVLIYGVFIVLGAVPVLIYLHHREDNVLAGLLGIAAALFCLGILSITYIFSYISLFCINVIPFLLHWFAWIRITVKKADVRSHIFPLLTVWLLLLANALCFRNPIALGCAFLYILIAALLYKPEKKQENSEEPDNT